VRALVLSSHYRDASSRSKLRALVGLGVEVIAGIPGASAGTDGGVQIVPIPVRGDPARPDRLRWHGATLKRLLSEIRPALVQVEEDVGSPLVASVATYCRRTGIPLVVMSWQAAPSTSGFFARRRTARALATAAGVIGGNQRVADRLQEQAPNALATAIPRAGVAPPPGPRGPPGEDLVIGSIGRLSPERRVDRLIQALGQTFGRWRLVVVGTGPEQEPIEDAITRLGLASRVRWLGGVRRETLEEAWAEIDCLVLPWDETAEAIESHSTLLLESMARGIAPVVSQAGALPELVGDAGAVVSDPGALTELLQRWVAEPARCHALGQRARQRVLERFVDSAIAARTVEFWRAVLARQSTPD
jgi:glycosyltransferase involved in cell wall biosynthesis